MLLWLILIWFLLHHLRSIWAKFGLAVVLNPVSATEKGEKGHFGLWFDLDLAL